MRSPLRAIGRRLRRLWRREDGTATIEFTIFVPIVLVIFVAAIEAGAYMIRHVMLERGLDLVLRDFRLGRLNSLNHDQLRDRICDRVSLISDCRNNLKVWMQPIDPASWSDEQQLLSHVYCGDRNDPLNSRPPGAIAPGGSNEIMLIRICVLESPMFPSTPLAMRLRADSRTGDYELATASVVVNEPQ